MNIDSKYDVALSFAGEERIYVDNVANELRRQGINVFYDRFEEADLWGKDLYAYLSEIYQKKAQFTVMFISKAYGEKLWTNHERMAAQARAFQESQEYILPARFDDTEIPGILPTIGYISLKDRTSEELVSIIKRKLISSGVTIPSEIVRKNFSVKSYSPVTNTSQFSLEICDDLEKGIEGAIVTLQADNGTTLNGTTDKNGCCLLEIKTRRLYLALIAHPNYPASIIDKIDPSSSVKIRLPKKESIGSTIFHSTGNIPGLKGRLNPILDPSNRTYLYADNIAINGGMPQPTNFSINEPIELEDADGIIIHATVKHIAGRVSLLQFTRHSES